MGRKRYQSIDLPLELALRILTKYVEALACEKPKTTQQRMLFLLTKSLTVFKYRHFIGLRQNFNILVLYSLLKNRDVSLPLLQRTVGVGPLLFGMALNNQRDLPAIFIRSKVNLLA